MTRKILSLLFMTFLLITVLVSCSDKKEEEIDVTNINLDITQTALAPGDSLTLVATVAPLGAKGVSWFSSDNSVVTVKDGTITAVANGNAVIICASDNGIFAMCRVSVDSGLCKHTDVEWVVLTEPTCTKEGLKYSYCKNAACGMRLEDVAIEKAPHTPGEVTRQNEVASTCAAEGSYEEIAYCIVCGDLAYKETKTVAKLPHNFGEWKTVTESTCYVAGSQVQTCLECNHKNEEELPVREHFTTTVAAKEPTCTSEGWDVSYDCIPLSLSFDPRALDTASAAKFLRELCASLESFELLLIK